jgi:hypothetical protein
MNRSMRVQALHLTQRHRHAPTRRGGHPRPALPETGFDLRSRVSGGPVDNAHYGCGCGYQFSAAVSTSVSCPHCGSLQAW